MFEPGPLDLECSLLTIRLPRLPPSFKKTDPLQYNFSTALPLTQGVDPSYDINNSLVSSRQGT